MATDPPADLPSDPVTRPSVSGRFSPATFVASRCCCRRSPLLMPMLRVTVSESARAPLVE